MTDELRSRVVTNDPLTLANISYHPDADTDREQIWLDDIDGLCVSYRRAGMEDSFDFLVDEVTHTVDGLTFLVGKLVNDPPFHDGSVVGEHGRTRYLQVRPYDRIWVY